MATASPIGRPDGATLRSSTGEDRFLIRDIGWDKYEALLELFGDDGPRLNYANGNVELMSPLPVHGKYAKLLGVMVETIAEELGIRLESYGITTFKRRAVDRGFEPDECYYFANIDRLRGEKRIDLDVEPPPDLCIEVEITKSLLPKLDIYAKIGVPEVWRFDGEILTVFLLRPEGCYFPSERSASLPFVPMAEIARFLREYATGQELPWRRAFRAWVREVVAPLRDRGEAGAG